MATKEHVRGHVDVHALAYQLRSVLAPEEALWELEQLQVAELEMRGGEVAAIRKLTRVDGTVATLAEVFSLVGEGDSPLGPGGM